MATTDTYDRLPLSAIHIQRDSRQRREVSTKGLRESISKWGVLQPIIIHRGAGADGRHLLVAGERRLQSCIELALPDIPVRYAEDLSPIEAQIIELEENIKRQDLDWQDVTRGVATIHQLYEGLTPGWTQERTADAIGLTKGWLSVNLRVARDLADPKICEAGTVREAYNILVRRDARLAGNELAELLEEASPFGKVPPAQPSEVLASSSGPTTLMLAQPRLIPADAAKSILHESFLQWAPRYTGQKFNFIHCDFPYGIRLFDGPESGRDRHDSAYDDSAESYWRLVDCLIENLPRIMSVTGHLMFWCTSRVEVMAKTLERLSANGTGLQFYPHPLVWHKSDNTGIAADHQHHPKHVYEVALFAMRGHRPIVKVVHDLHSAPPDRRLHVSTKPEPVLKYFFSMIVDDQTLLLDPTCGSGSALRAAEALGARGVLGMDIDEQTVGIARGVLRQARALRTVSRSLSA